MFELYNLIHLFQFICHSGSFPPTPCHFGFFCFVLEYMNYQNYCCLLKLELQKVEDVYVYAGIRSDKWLPLAPVSQAVSLF